MNAQLNTDALAKLRGSLKRGDMSKIAEQTGYARTTVYNILHGRSNNEKVVNAAIALVEARQMHAKSIERRIEAVTR